VRQRQDDRLASQPHPASRILQKLGVASNAELVQYAMRHRLVD